MIDLGIRPFENDAAIEMLSEFEENRSFSNLRMAIENCVSDEYLEIETVQEGVAALEIIAAINGSPCYDFPALDSISLKEMQEKYEEKVTTFLMELCEDAMAILERVEDNGLNELHDEDGNLKEWFLILSDLRDRLF